MVKNLKSKSSNLQSRMESRNTNWAATRDEQRAPSEIELHMQQVAMSLVEDRTGRSALPSDADLPLLNYHRASGVPATRSLPARDCHGADRETYHVQGAGPRHSHTGGSSQVQQSMRHPVPGVSRQRGGKWPEYHTQESPIPSPPDLPRTNWQEYYPQFRATKEQAAAQQTSENTRSQANSLYENYKEQMRAEVKAEAKAELKAEAIAAVKAEAEAKTNNSLKSPEAYIKPFCDFMTENPTIFHAVSAFEDRLIKAGFKKLSERTNWDDHLGQDGKYFISRNGSALIAFTIGGKYKAGNGVAMVAGHVDALTARLKPISNKKTTAGYVQLGVAPYAGGLNATWWDRDLGVGGRVVVKDSKTGKITTKLVKLGWPIARIPTLAPHFGVGMMGQSNKETQMIPIIGLDTSDSSSVTEDFANLTLGGAGSFAATQPPKLLKAIAGELSITDYSTILNWELELFDTQPAQTIGLDREFISAGRIDDKVCSWAAVEGLLASAESGIKDDGIIKLVGVFDDEEIGSQLRQGAKSNFLPSVIERIVNSCNGSNNANTLSQTYANSFLISADVTHAVNPNFLASYLENHAPRLNVGLCIGADSNGHLTTDSVSTSLLTRIAEKSDNKLQLFMIRNDSRSGGTVGPMLSSAMGVRAIDAGIPQLSMHSIRATIGDKDPGLGVKIFAGFFDNYEEVDSEFDPSMG